MLRLGAEQKPSSPCAHFSRPADKPAIRICSREKERESEEYTAEEEEAEGV